MNLEITSLPFAHEPWSLYQGSLEKMIETNHGILSFLLVVNSKKCVRCWMPISTSLYESGKPVLILRELYLLMCLLYIKTRTRGNDKHKSARRKCLWDEKISQTTMVALTLIEMVLWMFDRIFYIRIETLHAHQFL